MTGVTTVQLVPGGIDGAASTTNRSKIFTSAITAGNFMVAYVGSHGFDPGGLTVTDDKSNTWNRLGSIYDGGGRGPTVFWALANAAAQAAAPTITVQKGGISCSVALLLEEVNCPSGTFLDVSPASAANPNSGSTGPFTQTIGPNNFTHCSVRVCGAAPEAAYATFTPATGFAEISNQTSTPGSLQLSVIKKDTTSTGTITAGWTSATAADAMPQVAFIMRGTTTLPTITGVSTATPQYQGSLTITGVNFGASVGTATLGGKTQTVTFWGDTSITVTVDRGTNKYGVALNLQITTAASVNSNTFTGITGLIPQTGYSYVNLGTINATASHRLTATTAQDLASGYQVAWDTNSGQTTVLTDATFVTYVSTGFNAEACNSFGWGSLGLQRIN